MVDLRHVVLDVLKPHDPPLLEFTERLAGAETVDGVSATLIELDQEVQNVEFAVAGEALDYAAVERVIEDLGGSVHSVDQVAYGESVDEERRTPRGE